MVPSSGEAGVGRAGQLARARYDWGEGWKDAARRVNTTLAKFLEVMASRGERNACTTCTTYIYHEVLVTSMTTKSLGLVVPILVCQSDLGGSFYLSLTVEEKGKSR